MKKEVILLVFLLCVVGGDLVAHPTGAPLFTFPVIPCRVFDTRVSLGPLPGQTGLSVFVRGSNLQASDGAKKADCGIPLKAEAVIANVASVSPTTTSYLMINATGEVQANFYSRLTYNLGQNISNEMVIDLCNTFLYPTPHQPCAFDGLRYSDFQVLNQGPSGTSTHVVVDVIGYLARE